ncbi:arginase family protein [Pinibacter aurantiacus]|uniref:Arginase family protein n=1 Tax=Pinibacter aurantiacus TaxID=2851599 RepID=A0A9E2W7C2_9BACT|nr:arginase family protein [Pinibacter aurantiacus]MBV4356386.1 arginase family protein [Pinibacter aurantiacus]
MSDLQSLADFLEPVNLAALNNDEGYKDGQIGKIIHVYEDELPDIEQVDLVFIGCKETRGAGFANTPSLAADAIRQEFYSLYYWHTNLQIADLGNVKTGASLNDSYAVVKMVAKELIDMGKTVVILGGSHDMTLAQYYVYSQRTQIIEATCIDALINLDIDSPLRKDNFLMEMLTGEPNFIKHYNHIGFQSYYVHPHMLETIDKLRFDCFRVGHAKEFMEEMEPVIRNSNMLSFDMAAFAHAYAPAGAVSPNGFIGEEACILMRYAGMSPNISTIGIYGFDEKLDKDGLTAKQISHMLWYLMDGASRGKMEATLDERDSFYEYHLTFSEIETTFLQSKKTGRWWMRLPDETFIACSHKDYLQASSNELPERWLRAQERQ